ncbi:MAG: WD40 repeat domain-containing protein [Chloroflexi bacterium]|nr:MAG: WD40 repeat domain-containing protein [Chloroflexota bacterium]MBL1194926.1 WD40 repeat domain-containing protein [Chloroflexota bacterium]NOH12217.1 WD40 repeat domain-containing protein [Chloroflexota bacterium]
MDEPVVIEAHDSHCNDVEFTEDSKTLVSAGMDNVVKLWSVGDWKHKKTFEGHEKSVNSLSFSPDGKTLVTGSTDESLNLWSFPGGKLKESRPRSASGAQVSSDGKYIASVIRHKIKVWDYASGEELFKVDDHDKNRGVMFSPDSKTLFTSGLSDHISMWSVPDGEHLGRLEGHKKVVMSMKFAKGGNFFASTGYEGTLRVWFAEDWEEVMAIPLDFRGGLLSLAISPDNKTIAISDSHRIILVAVEKGAIEEEIELKPKGVYALDFSPDGKWLANSAADGRVRVWATA